MDTPTLSGRSLARTRRLTVVAQDPDVKKGRKILRAEVDVPAEVLAPGPRGYRVHVIDYDATTRTLYRPFEYPDFSGGDRFVDPFEKASDDRILGDPSFHAQNVYAIVMRTLSRFEFALGRRVGWGFDGHQIKVAPHAFADANAFYSERDEALLFGYFPGKRGMVFSCLSHDVVAHETSHALVDGLRRRFTDPSSPDQAAFHEGFSDVVALLSVFALKGIALELLRGEIDEDTKVDEKFLRESVLLGLAEQMGSELSSVRGQALRRSAELEPSREYLKKEEYAEPHRRGEILVAAMMNAFLSVWMRRLRRGGALDEDRVSIDRLAEEGADAADYLLTMTIRALDYTPPVHLEFGDFLSALLTADHEIRPDDARYGFRETLRESFAAYGIRPASPGDGEKGLWCPPEKEMRHDRVRFESLTRDHDEMFRFVWENRKDLGLFEGAYSRVESLRPCLRIAPDDGFPLRETVAECVQLLRLEARELSRLGIEKPDEMPPETEVTLAGGATLVFDEYGGLKFAITNRLDDRKKQARRLEDLWRFGHFSRGASLRRRFSALHRLRGVQGTSLARERW